MDSVHRQSPKACSALCDKTEGCVAWSWNTVNESCYAQSSCEQRVPNSNMVSGLKASFEGRWYFIDDAGEADMIDQVDYFDIDVDKNGKMTLEDIDGRGKLETASGSSHDAQQRGDELEMTLEDNNGTSIGTTQVRLTDGKLKVQVRVWLPEEGSHTEFRAEKKELVLTPFQRVTVREDHVISAADVRLSPRYMPGIAPFPLKQGDIGTVHDPEHPYKTGVIFDVDQGKIVWVNDSLLVQSTGPEEVSEAEVKGVLEDLGDELIKAIRDPITKQILRDPVKFGGHTYERKSIENASRQAGVDLQTPTPDLTIRSLVSAVMQKIDAARDGSPNLPKEPSEKEIRDVLNILGDDLTETISDPITWQIMRDPAKAADGFTYERSSIRKWIQQAQVESRTPMGRFGVPLSSTELTTDYTLGALVSALVQRVIAVRAAGVKIQKHWKGFHVRGALLGITKNYRRLSVLGRMPGDIAKGFSRHAADKGGSF